MLAPQRHLRVLVVVRFETYRTAVFVRERRAGLAAPVRGGVANLVERPMGRRNAVSRTEGGARFPAVFFRPRPRPRDRDLERRGVPRGVPRDDRPQGIPRPRPVMPAAAFAPAPVPPLAAASFAPSVGHHPAAAAARGALAEAPMTASSDDIVAALAELFKQPPPLPSRGDRGGVSVLAAVRGVRAVPGRAARTAVRQRRGHRRRAVPRRAVVAAVPRRARGRGLQERVLGSAASRAAAPRRARVVAVVRARRRAAQRREL
eukprot:29477-Pelagococcus_subviridis.AAC.4